MLFNYCVCVFHLHQAIHLTYVHPHVHQASRLMYAPSHIGYNKTLDYHIQQATDRHLTLQWRTLHPLAVFVTASRRHICMCGTRHTVTRRPILPHRIVPHHATETPPHRHKPVPHNIILKVTPSLAI